MANIVTTERRGKVLIAHMDDGKVNAVGFELIAGIEAALQTVEADDELGALVLHGRPGKFSAGFDLSVVRGDDPDAARNLIADGGQLVHTLYGARVPIVAACTGHALAAGAMILCGCDYRVGGDGDAKIAMNEVAIGMALPEWALTILVERLTETYLQRSAILAEVFDPRGAVAAGFLDEVVDAASVDGTPVGSDPVLDRAVEVAEGFAEHLHPAAHVVSKRRLRGDMLAQLQSDVDDFRANGSL